jgi:hypothetical protein
MNVAAVAEVVAFPVASLSDLAADVDALAALQAEIAKLEKQARTLRSSVREGMTRGGLDAFVSGRGHRASLFESITWKADRTEATRLFSAEVVAAIFKPSKSTTLRVK